MTSISKPFDHNENTSLASPQQSALEMQKQISELEEVVAEQKIEE